MAVLFTARSSTSRRTILVVMLSSFTLSLVRRISTLSPGLAKPATAVTSFTEKEIARMPGGMSPRKPDDPRADTFRAVSTSPSCMGTDTVLPIAARTSVKAPFGMASGLIFTVFTISSVITVLAGISCASSTTAVTDACCAPAGDSSSEERSI